MANKLTKTTVDGLRPKADRDAFLWCGELRGFGVRVKPSGVKTFLIQYRTDHGNTRRYSLGQHGRLTVEEARKQAKIKLAEVAQGRDPSTARKSARQIKTVADLKAPTRSTSMRGACDATSSRDWVANRSMR